MVQLYEAREALGMEAGDSHRFYLRKMSMIEVPANGTLPVPAADPGKQRGAKHGGDDHGGGRASQEAYKRGAAFALIVQRQESGLRASFEKPRTGVFGELGKAASDVSAALLEAEAGKARRRGAKADEDRKSVV